MSGLAVGIDGKGVMKDRANGEKNIVHGIP